jgi:hypothetical protein
VEFVHILCYARNLHFEEKPDYDALRRCLRKLIERDGKSINEYTFDWCDASKLLCHLLNLTEATNKEASIVKRDKKPPNIQIDSKNRLMI